MKENQGGHNWRNGTWSFAEMKIRIAELENRLLDKEEEIDRLRRCITNGERG